MNKQRKKTLAGLCQALRNLGVERSEQLANLADTIETIQGELIDVQADEEAAYDNMPDGLQRSEKGEHMQEVIDQLSEAIEHLQELVNEVNSVKGLIESTAEEIEALL